jgi:predicted transcriptional regulator
MKNRSRTEIIAAILDIVGNGNTKTKIMYKAYLSYAQMMGYLSILEENKLVEPQKSGKVYKITEKGRKYLEHYKKIDEMILTDMEKK